MQRRALLATVAGVFALAGCAGTTDSSGEPTSESTPSPDGSTASHRDPTPSPHDPDDCPTSMEFGVDRPDELDRESVVRFLERYERAYTREEVLTRDVDRLEGPSASVTSVETDGAGYVVELEVTWATWDTDVTTIDATLDDPAADLEPKSVDDVDHELLRDLAREAAANDEPVTEEVNGTLPPELREAYDELPADWDGRYVDVEGTTIRFTTTELEIHGDGFDTASYYVDERVVRRADDDGDPAEAELLECRE